MFSLDVGGFREDGASKKKPATLSAADRKVERMAARKRARG
jgi:hypothetical protein